MPQPLYAPGPYTTSPVEYLHSIQDARTGAPLYEFEHQEYELDLGFARPSHSEELPGSDAPYDPYGTEGNPMATRTITLAFMKLYRAVRGETMTTARMVLNRHLASGRQVRLVLMDASGERWIGLAKATNLPRNVSKLSTIYDRYEVTFELNPPVFRKLYPSTWLLFDDNPPFLWDAAVPVRFDTQQLPRIMLNSRYCEGAAVNEGDAPDKYCVLTVRGPYPPFQVYNNSAIQSDGRPLLWQWGQELGPTDTLVMDVGAGSLRLNGQPAFDSRFMAFQGDWFEIRPGGNTIVVTTGGAVPSAGGGSLELDIRDTRY